MPASASEAWEMDMDLHTTPLRMELERGQTLGLSDARGASVSVHAGEVWVTQEGDRADRVLGAGERLVLERDGLAVLQALADARVAIGTGPVAVAAAGASSRPALRLPRRWYVGASHAA
jgi:hypothetical protein